ncbi:TadE/TadG family type IV pilus assembly protein [Adlercreutzia sp. ZJ242]|uniref:TadE/TadG family type IV pilus assembly protein n=1 Tax=Adlercreutzia sp. ZJ242 TaxID=2709409 RepID=UPI001F14DAD8|nr:TadE/TadG family type IV pilus assembly protein [Adlercreutzia sp. ZJ242]
MTCAVMRGLRRLARCERGQATVEAAFALPVVMVLVLLLVQPGIILYDRIVMQGAAAEGCRLLATSAGDARVDEDFIRRRLGAVPEQDLFHVHGGACTWRIGLEGGEASERVGVSISTEVKPLPLIGAGAAFLGMTNERGNLVVSVHVEQPAQPAWVAGDASGLDPAGWIGAWQ